MEVSSAVSSVVSMRAAQSRSYTSVAMLGKALDTATSQATALLEALPPPAGFVYGSGGQSSAAPSTVDIRM